MKFLLFNVMAALALAYLFLRGSGLPSSPAGEPAVLAEPADAPPAQASRQAPPERATVPPVEAKIDVVPPSVHAVPERRGTEPERRHSVVADPSRERRRDLGRIARDMDRFAADRLAR